MTKNLSVLGSTGSVGRQTLEVCEKLNIKVTALSANKNIKLLEEQIRRFKPKSAAVFDDVSAKNLKIAVKDLSIKIYSGMQGLCEVAQESTADAVLTAVSGVIGLQPTFAAIKSGKNIALANKETLVAGGELVMKAASKNNIKIFPVDSEHSAIFQCLDDNNKKYIKKLILTASGGPFLGKTFKELENVTVSDALKHPNWNMGAKITVDSATMMNKGLEIIEASHLFDVPAGKIDAIIHKESLIHSFVEFDDNSVLAQISNPDMRLPIQYALTYPERKKSLLKPFDFSKITNFSLSPLENWQNKAIEICKNALKTGGAAPCIVNAANEFAVDLFLKNKLKFSKILTVIENAAETFKFKKITKLEDILYIDEKVKEKLSDLFNKNLI